MTTFRDNNFTPSQIKLVDLTVRGASKKYKFIKGWSFSPDYKNYKAHLYIILFVDWKKIGEFLGAKPKKHWEKELNNEDVLSSSIITTFFEINGKEIPFDDGYNISIGIVNYIMDLYESLPDDNKIFYENIYFDGNHIYPVKLSVTEFKTFKNNQ